MAQRARDQAKRERADARGRRRSLLTRPFEALDDAAGEGDGAEALDAAKQAARTAAAAAVAGGVAGAAKALIQRHSHGDDGEDEDEAERADEEQADEQAPRNRPTMSEQDADAADEPQAEEEEGPDAEQREDEQPAAEKEGRENGKPQKGAPSSDVADVVDRARSQLTDLLDKEVDSVSGISRQNGSWSVTVEVVEVHRIPDSTDVLSSYEVVLDDDKNLVSLERRGRYRRSQVEEER